MLGTSASELAHVGSTLPRFPVSAPQRLSSCQTDSQIVLQPLCNLFVGYLWGNVLLFLDPLR